MFVMMVRMFNPKLIAARWYFGEFMHEDLPRIAMDALEHESDGPMLRRLAGLIKPTSGDLSAQEIDGAFREMGIAAPLSIRDSQLILATETARAVAAHMQKPIDAAVHIRIYICGLQAPPPELATIVKLAQRAKHTRGLPWNRVEKQIRDALADFLATRP